MTSSLHESAGRASSPSVPGRQRRAGRTTAVALLAALAVSGATALPAQAAEAQDPSDDIGFLYAAAVGERVAREAYRLGARQVRPSERAAFKEARSKKSASIRALSRALGEDAPTNADLKIVIPAKRLADRAAVLELVRELETSLVGLGRAGLADATDLTVRRSMAGLVLTDAQLLTRVRGFQRRDPIRVPGRVSVERIGDKLDGFLVAPDEA